MIESEKKLKDLQKKLISGDRKVVSDAIISLRSENPFKGAIGLVVNLFDKSGDLLVKDLIRNFLNDIKESALRTEIIEETMKDYKPDTTSMLVSSCWQSGLDYSGFAIQFVNVFIKGDYLTALECFTVIEESIPGIIYEQKCKIIDLLEENKGNFSVEKNKLLEALLMVLV
jgi:hypothetical protein